MRHKSVVFAVLFALGCAAALFSSPIALSAQELKGKEGLSQVDFVDVKSISSSKNIPCPLRALRSVFGDQNPWFPARF